jgi:hypothetical protein
MSSRNEKRNYIYYLRSFTVCVVAVLPALFLVWAGGEPAYLAERSSEGQEAALTFRIGEKLSYNVSFGKFANAAYAETLVASRGKLSGRDAVEIRGRVKTLEMVSAAFFMVDESRSVYASPDTGLPLYITSNSKNTILPQEKISNYLSQPISGYDLLSVLYKARGSAGAGTYPVFENDQASSVTFIPTNAEKVKTEAGEFDTVISLVQSPMLTDFGIRDVKINFTADDARIPVLIRFKTDKGDFRAVITAIALPSQGTTEEQPTSTPTPTPLPTAVPRQTPTPEPYLDNRPLLPELGFQIGEALEYGISSGTRPLGRILFNVQERKQFQKADSLLLTATVTAVQPGTTTLVLGDSAKTQVDPETLAPIWASTSFSSGLRGLKQTLTFDPKSGEVKFGSPRGIDAPIGTHNILSLLYAMRSFNLKPSKVANNPVNDTRVAVFWDDKPLIFTLRPSNPAEIVVSGENVLAQLISINTQNAELDRLALKVWLRVADRVPVKIAAGALQADLISSSTRLP